MAPYTLLTGWLLLLVSASSFAGAYKCDSAKARLCKDNPGTAQCHPCDGSPSAYLQCNNDGSYYQGKCPPEKVMDYVTRQCVKKGSEGGLCPDWPCPYLCCDESFAYEAKPGYHPLVNPNVQVGNKTITLDDSLYPYGKSWFIECPFFGHCQLGMAVKITVTCPAEGTPDKPKPWHFHQHFKADWDYATVNEQFIPKRYEDIHARCGDLLTLHWNEVGDFHGIVALLPGKLDRNTPVVMGPPRMKYQCPPSFDGPPLPNKNVEQIVYVSPNGTVTFGPYHTAKSFFLVCPVAKHCRLGMIFKVVVTKPKTTPYKPKTITVEWYEPDQKYENFIFPDVHMNFGDKLVVYWVLPVHGIWKYPTYGVNKIVPYAEF